MIVRQICAKRHKENPVSIENTGFFVDIIISWRFHATFELLGYRSITLNNVYYLLALHRISSNIFCIDQYRLYRVAPDLRHDTVPN